MSGESFGSLVLWAANVIQGDLVDRARCGAAAGFGSMSVTTLDLEQWAAAGKTPADLRRECERIGIGISAVDPYLGWYPAWDPTAFKGEGAEMLRATEDEALRYCSELHAPFLTIVGPFDDAGAPLDEVVESLGAFADRAAAYGVKPHLEPILGSRIDSLDLAREVVEAVDRDNLGILIDTYNLARGGETVEALAQVPARRIFQVQLADATVEQKGTTYFDDALHHRLLPGEGELAINPYVEVLARDGVLPPTGPEVFSDELARLSTFDAATTTKARCVEYLTTVGVGGTIDPWS